MSVTDPYSNIFTKLYLGLSLEDAGYDDLGLDSDDPVLTDLAVWYNWLHIREYFFKLKNLNLDEFVEVTQEELQQFLVEAQQTYFNDYVITAHSDKLGASLNMQNIQALESAINDAKDYPNKVFYLINEDHE